MSKIKLTTDDNILDEIPLSEYPRPQFKRDSYLCLNGKWDLCFSYDEKIPTDFDQKVIVPFPVESDLSGVSHYLQKDEYIYYRKTFSLDSSFIKEIVELHFDGIDQISWIYLNGKLIKEHIGGYTPFSVYIQDYLKESNTLIVKVKDNLDKSLCYGKQSQKSKGMWYTKTSGIYKSVWLESYNKNHFSSLKITPTLNNVTINVDSNIKEKKIVISTPEGTIEKEFFDNQITIDIINPINWTSDNPYLYHFKLISKDDIIESYFALRTIKIEKVNNVPRILLNNKPIFFHGLLDQGYFPDGLLTPKSYQKYEDELLNIKSLGFNTIRKHIKLEPLYFYYLCDKLGVFVFQDFINNDKYSFFKESVLPTIGFQNFASYGKRRKQTIKDNFINQGKEIIDLLYNHPCVIYYTIFNEGWGQFDADKTYSLMKKLDPTRIFDATSGWFNGKLSDVTSKHIYFKKVKIKKSNRPIIISEFGGYVYKDLNHSFNLEKTFGYKIFKSKEEYQKALYNLYIEQIVPFINKGLCGAIYTQITDVEDETNGLLTFDRKVLKVNTNDMLEISKQLKITES